MLLLLPGELRGVVFGQFGEEALASLGVIDVLQHDIRGGGRVAIVGFPGRGGTGRRLPRFD
jgi:hypothetical protein